MAGLINQIGKQIRILRKNRGLTQEQLGEKVKLPQSYIGGVERGEKNISIETLERFILALKVSPSELFGTELPSDKEKILDLLKVLLQNRSLKEIEIIYNLSKDVLSAFDAKNAD
ncbi:helix-turn-helix domain-containing protein [Brevibacillus antibioticus]|uniref:Helix-turn-helix transcriptional regulator n=1 Tax=Brevibacillus antibioticus TaxID=2570228 RepID=A0A4V5TQR8_9BACL|nr:helix-turn-helix transcriptional regulator [Brevibacillus antibioticus]TKI54813.1 helix-turn-helix transcriptional regulator [Brevibacillus antibioticus]